MIAVDILRRPQTLCGLSVWTSSDAMRAKELIEAREESEEFDTVKKQEQKNGAFDKEKWQ